MENAKKVWILSNGELVSIGDNIQVDNGKEVYMANVVDIDEKVIIYTISTGEEFDPYFSELKDIRVVK